MKPVIVTQDINCTRCKKGLIKISYEIQLNVAHELKTFREVEQTNLFIYSLILLIVTAWYLYYIIFRLYYLKHRHLEKETLSDRVFPS